LSANYKTSAEKLLLPFSRMRSFLNLQALIYYTKLTLAADEAGTPTTVEKSKFMSLPLILTLGAFWFKIFSL